MRISDWSSDVCSSDLGGTPERFAEAQARLLGHRPGVALIAVLSVSGRAHAGTGGTDDAVHEPLGQRGRPDDAHALATGRLPRDGHPVGVAAERRDVVTNRSEEHTSELQSLMRISYA